MTSITELHKKLLLSSIVDMTKPNLNKFDRALILKKYMKDNNISMGEFCKEFNFKKSTVSGWLKWNELGKTEYTRMKNKGLSESDITNSLKGTDISKEGIFFKKIQEINKYISENKIKYNTELLQEIDTLIKKLNLILFRNKND